MSGTAMGAGRRAIPRRAASADPRAGQDQTLLALVVMALLAVVVALSAVGAGTIARPLFMVFALVICWMARRRSPWLYLSATLWFWLITAFVRRMIEWRGGFNSGDIVLATPSLTALLILPDILKCRGLLTRPGVGYALLLFACVMYGLFVSFVHGELLAGSYAGVDWVIPVFYLFLFICNAERIDEAEAHVATFMTFSLLFVVPYSLYQYFLMPDWDAVWLVQSGMGSIGHPLPMESRVFGPVNNPGMLAIWLGTCLVLLSYFRGRVLLLLTPFIFLLVMIGMVRAVYGSVILAMIAGVATGRGGFGRLLMVALAVGVSGYIGLAVLNPVVTDQITKRLQSMQNLSADDSAQVRAQIYAETPALINANPFGLGLGSQGRGQAAQASGALATVNVDSGPLSVFLALGWGAGSLYIFGIVMLIFRTLFVGRRYNSGVASAMAAASIVAFGTFPFINVIGFNGVVMWICLGYPLAVEIRATGAVPSGATPPARRRLTGSA